MVDDKCRSAQMFFYGLRRIKKKNGISWKKAGEKLSKKSGLSVDRIAALLEAKDYTTSQLHDVSCALKINISNLLGLEEREFVEIEMAFLNEFGKKNPPIKLLYILRQLYDDCRRELLKTSKEVQK